MLQPIIQFFITIVSKMFSFFKFGSLSSFIKNNEYQSFPTSFSTPFFEEEEDHLSYFSMEDDDFHSVDDSLFYESDSSTFDSF